VLAAIVSGLLGWFAARKGLAPPRAMKTRAVVVTGQQLGQRMPVEAVPIEMADLALELNQMPDRLEDAFRRLSEFASDLAHELRTPISNLLTQTEVTLSTKRDAETYRDILASNAEELQRLARTVADMLFLAKTERGVDLPNWEWFSAAQEAQALLEFYDAVAEEKCVKLNLHGEGNILGDRLMFRRAVSNLLSNALCHTWERGEVTIEVSETPEATLVAVENTGDDIDPHALPRLFDRFFRVAAARAHPEPDGAGLGLSITRAIVEAHGGRASASSSQGRTRFMLEFPRRISPVPSRK
jgi:two-component system heavy metal sensor histidine kinase CusS